LAGAFFVYENARIVLLMSGFASLGAMVMHYVIQAGIIDGCKT